MKKIAVLFVCAVLAIQLAVNEASAGVCSDQSNGSRFCRADLDKNDSLSPSEFQTGFPEINIQAFSVLDRNSDGAIDIKEWDAFMGSHSMQGNMPPRSEGGHLIAPPKGGTAPMKQ